MEVRKSEWKENAMENISKYLHRGGELQGDVPQLLGGADLLNTIGVAMGLPMCDPDNWTKCQLEKALKGELVYFENEARQAIDVIARQIQHCCEGDDRNYVTVLPIELYSDGKLYELHIFRVKRNMKSKNYYIDNDGRRYNTPSEWLDQNKLPPGEMTYPSSLKLSVESNGKVPVVCFADTPRMRWVSKIVRRLDAATNVVWGASAALACATGGLASPVVMAGLSATAAAMSVLRAAYQFAENAPHGVNVESFPRLDLRLLSDVVANSTCCRPIGATKRLESLVKRGRQISKALHVLHGIANGVSDSAIFNLLLTEYKDLTAFDNLMYIASVAFWMKGLFCYKTPAVIIRDSENYLFTILTKGLSQEEASEITVMRTLIQNDTKLLLHFLASMKANVSLKDYSRKLIDCLQYYNIVSILTPEQIDAFQGLRLNMSHEMNLMLELRRVSKTYHLNSTETIEMVLDMWQYTSTSNTNEGGSAILNEGNLVLGRAPPIKIDQLPNLSAPMIKFFGEHLSQVDLDISGHWSTSVPVLLQLQSYGMFTTCPVTRVVSAGRAVVSLNDLLEISIHRLNAISVEDCITIFRMLGSLNHDIKSSNLPLEIMRLCVRLHRLRLECHRNEIVVKISQYLNNHPALLKLVQSDLQSHEKDRLYTLLNDVELCKGNLYMDEMMAWVSEKNPTNITELVAYSEFVMVLVENKAPKLPLNKK